MKFVFSDKTGTLTQNDMRFKCCAIANKVKLPKSKQCPERRTKCPQRRTISQIQTNFVKIVRTSKLFGFRDSCANKLYGNSMDIENRVSVVGGSQSMVSASSSGAPFKWGHTGLKNVDFRVIFA